MEDSIFWDARAFIALSDKRYRYHADARAVFAMLEQQNHFMVTTEAVLTEVGNALSKAQFRPYARQQLRYVRRMVEGNLGDVYPVSHELWERAWDLYDRRPDKDWGHTDCISFVVMQDLGLTTAFTADHHFEQAGFVRLVKID